MSRIALFGTCPLPFEPLPVAGPALRTWQFARPLLEDGHEVLIVALRTEGCYPEDTAPETLSHPRERLAVRNLAHLVFSDEARIRAILTEFRPDAIIGAGSLLPTSVAASMVEFAPVWADLFGDAISEIQSKAGIYGHEATRDEIFHAWKILTGILVRADRYSALSEPQRYALIGQLALAGRLGAHNDGCELTAHIPCGIDETAPAANDATPRAEAARKLGLEALADPAVFTLMWSGSYNTWTDPETLFRGVDLAMDRDPAIHFLSVGGGTAGYNPRLYAEFVARVDESPHRTRYHLRGWVPFGDVPLCYRVADLGLNVDRFTYEGVLGSRNRVVQFLHHGVPVLTTALSEVTRALAAEGGLVSFPLGSAEGFADAAIAASRNRESLRASGERGRAFVRAKYNFRDTTTALRAWAAAPSRAPDNVALVRETGSLPGPGAYMIEPQRLMDSPHFQPWLRELEATRPSRLAAKIDRIGRKLKGK